MNSSNTTGDTPKHPPLHSVLLFLGLAVLVFFLALTVHSLWSDAGRVVFGWVLLIPNTLLVLTRVFAAIRKRSGHALPRRVSTIDAIGQVTFLAMGFADWLVFLSLYITTVNHHFGVTPGDALIFSIGLIR